MYDYTNGMPLLHIQTETRCIPFFYNKNKFKKIQAIISVRMWGKMYTHTLLVGLQIGAVWKSSMESSQKTWNGPTN